MYIQTCTVGYMARTSNAATSTEGSFELNMGFYVGRTVRVRRIWTPRIETLTPFYVLGVLHRCADG
jgi:hypothetical protein